MVAEIVSALAAPRRYLPILDYPWLSSPQSDAHITRRNNAAARLQPNKIVFADPTPAMLAAFAEYFPNNRIVVTRNASDLSSRRLKLINRKDTELRWGKRNLGIGLLLALQNKRALVCDEQHRALDISIVPGNSKHLVVCEAGDELKSVIAANYAYSIGAGFAIIPEAPEDVCDDLLESLYSLYGEAGQSPTDTLSNITRSIRGLAGLHNLDRFELITFVTRRLPWGLAFPEIPTTHLFWHPDLGIQLVNAITAEQPRSPGIRVALLIDPAASAGREYRFAARELAARGVFVRALPGPTATVHRVARSIELFPYDFLLISTHCGDVPGWRWTYRFRDRDGIDRTLVVDIGIGVEVVPGEEKLSVEQFTRFVSLDGVDWNDKEAKAKLNAGQAILDYIALTRDPDEGLQPVHKEEIPRVTGSAALRMADNNYIAFPRSLADEGTPIVFNNACGSWHRLAMNFSFSNARAYIGTLYPVVEAEAEGIARELLGKYFGKPLPVALWHAQNSAYGNASRRPYVVVGAHFQRLRTSTSSGPHYVARRMLKSLATWTARLSELESSASESSIRSHKDYIRFLTDDLKQIRARWAKKKQ